MDLEAEKSNELHKGQTAGAMFNIYYLAHAPTADLNKSYAQFGKGLVSTMLEGAVLNIKQFDKDPRNQKGDITYW